MSGWRWRFLRRDQATWRADARVQRQSNLRVFVRLREEWEDLSVWWKITITRGSERTWLPTGAVVNECNLVLKANYAGFLEINEEKAHKSNPWTLNSVVICLILKYEGTSRRPVRLSEHFDWKQVEPAGLALDAGDESFYRCWEVDSSLHSQIVTLNCDLYLPQGRF